MPCYYTFYVEINLIFNVYGALFLQTLLTMMMYNFIYLETEKY